jgi:two-component system NtrC family sensor kinase
MAVGVSRRKRFLKERLLHSQKMAALGELSASTAHEINNPLAISRGGASLGRILRQAGKKLVAQAFQSMQKTICFY